LVSCRIAAEAVECSPIKKSSLVESVSNKVGSSCVESTERRLALVRHEQGDRFDLPVSTQEAALRE